MHAKHFFLLPSYLWNKYYQSKQKNWWQRKEKAGTFLLNLTLFLVNVLPNFLLKPCIAFVAFVYYLFSQDERKNLGNFYDNIQGFLQKDKLSFFSKQRAIYRNFYHFGCAICDKIAVWRGKITYDNLLVANKALMDKELRSEEKGQILLVSHYGNIEIARALSNSLKKLDIVILVYQRNTLQFLSLINSVSENKLRVIYVDSLDVQSILELQSVVDNGGAYWDYGR